MRETKILDSKGQMFEGYRLLIGAIMGIMILLIIMGMITYMQGLQFQVSESRMIESLKSAVKTPDGSSVVCENALIQADKIYSARQFATVLNIDEECVSIDSTNSVAFEKTGDSLIKVNTQLQTDVYFQCRRNQDSCAVFCLVSFGKKPS